MKWDGRGGGRSPLWVPWAFIIEGHGGRVRGEDPLLQREAEAPCRGVVKKIQTAPDPHQPWRRCFPDFGRLPLFFKSDPPPGSDFLVIWGGAGGGAIS